MTDKITFRLVHPIARRNAADRCMTAPDGWIVTLRPPTRSLEQSAKMWAMLGDVAAQVVWHGRKLTAEEWKHVMTASLSRQDVVPGLDGCFVVLGQSTSKMSVKALSELIELISAFGAEHGVDWGRY